MKKWDLDPTTLDRAVAATHRARSLLAAGDTRPLDALLADENVSQQFRDAVRWGLEHGCTSLGFLAQVGRTRT